MDYKAIIAAMTLEEKCSMLSGKSFWESMDIERLGVPAVFLADGPHGIRKQAAAADHLGLNASIKATCFPTAATMANSFNTSLGEEVGAALGKEAVYQKVNVLLGPGINVKRNPLCGRNFEYFSEDPYLAGKMAAAYVRGIQSEGISACLKHFAANNQEYRRMVVDTIVDERTLREIYLTNFEIGVKEGKTKTIMSSYNKINGSYANEHEHLLRDILRDEWGFNGVIVSDWGGQNDRVAALKAGAELEMPTSGGVTNGEVYRAIKNGELDQIYLDEALERLLALVYDTEEVFNNQQAIKKESIPFYADAHHALARRAAEDSIVLLENKNGALPLKAGEKVAIVGDFAKLARFQGAGSSGVNPTRLDSTLELISTYGLNYIGFEPGFQRFGKESQDLINKAVQLAADADTVLVYLGLDEKIESEGCDRKNMKLAQNQKTLLKALKATGKKIVAVLSCGAALETEFSVDCDALVHAYLGGQAAAGAVLNVLLGKVNPSGKLSETYPVKYEDCSSATNFPESPHEGQSSPVRNVEYREGIFVGYRYFETAGVNVKYPFGYGLSYTSFEYSGLSVSEKGATFTIKNTGAVMGAEAAQLYIGLPNSKIFRAKKELKGFAKVVIQPGESKQITIPFDEYSFRYFNIKTNQWETEGGTYEISIGASSADIRLTGKIEKAGTTNILPYEGIDLPSYAFGKSANVSTKEFAKLYGRAVPDPRYPFYATNRLWADENTAISELRWARGWLGRIFAFVAKKFMILGMDQMPLRGLVRFGGPMSTGQLDGLIRLFNGGTRKYSKILTIPLGICSLGILGLPGLLWDLRKFFKEMKLRGLENKVLNLKKNGAFESDVWKAEKTIKKLKKKGEQNAAAIAQLEAQIKEWKKTAATENQLVLAQQKIDKQAAKIAKIDSAYYAWKKEKFDAKYSK